MAYSCRLRGNIIHTAKILLYCNEEHGYRYLDNTKIKSSCLSWFQQILEILTFDFGTRFHRYIGIENMNDNT